MKYHHASASVWSLGECFRLCREEAGITQQALAAACGVQERTIRTIEKNGNCSLRTRGRVLVGLNRLRGRNAFPEVQMAEDDGGVRLRPGAATWLQFPEREWLRQCHGPGALLTADYHVVPFHGQRSWGELNRLVAWCQQPTRIGLRIYKGGGGMGKTRLAVELCQMLAKPENGLWTGGFAQRAHFPKASSPWARLRDLSHPLVVVVDYAGEEEKTRMVSQLLLHLNACPAPKLRLLFLERDDLWLDRLHESRAAREILLGPLLARAGDDEAHLLPPVAISATERAESFRLAAKAFGIRLGLKSPGDAARELGGKLYESVLYIHIQALLAVLGTETLGKIAILRHLLGRERDYWKSRLETLGLSAGLLPAVEQAVLELSAHNGAPDLSSARRVLEAVELLKDQSQGVRRQIATLLRECYPLGKTGIGQLQPDELKHYLMRQYA